VADNHLRGFGIVLGERLFMQELLKGSPEANIASSGEALLIGNL
jgi:hypothetical protein